jgi:5-hydroxyisourate hydrolase-like protein (transthyretin family)
VALVYAGNANYQAKAPVDVGASNVQGIELAVGPGVTMRGRIRAEEGAAPAPDLTGVMVSLEPREAGAVFFGGEPGQPKEDGTFEIANVQPDAYRWNFNGLPKGAYVKAIRTPQADLLAGVDLTSGAPPGAIEVTISARAAAVTGTVQNPKTGNPASGATVVLVPQDPERREQTSYFKTITTDQNGSFSLEGVAPGEYEAYAWEDVEAGAYLDPDFLKPLEQQGEPVSLEEGDRKSLTLKLIPADR